MKLTFDHLDTQLENMFPTFTFLYKRFMRRYPDSFDYVSLSDDGSYMLGRKKVEATPVGPPRGFSYPSFHDVRDHLIDGYMTSLRHLDGLDANAVHILDTDVDHHACVGVVTYQPVKIQYE